MEYQITHRIQKVCFVGMSESCNWEVYLFHIDLEPRDDDDDDDDDDDVDDGDIYMYIHIYIHIIYLKSKDYILHVCAISWQTFVKFVHK